MSSVVDRRTSRKLTQGEIREEAEAMVNQNKIEAKKSTDARRVASRLHYEKLLSLGAHKPPSQTKYRLEDNMRMARPRPSQQMLRAKQHYIGVGERIRRDHQLQTLGFTRTPHFNPNLNPQKKVPTDKEEGKPKSITSIGVSPTKAPVPEPFHLPVYRTISPSFFAKLHNAIKVGYAKPDPSNENNNKKSKTWLERGEAQKVVQKAAIDLAVQEIATADIEVKKSRSGKSLKPKPSMSLKDAQKVLSLSHAPSFPMIDLHVNPKAKITSEKTATNKSCCKELVPGNKAVNSDKKRLRFADESAGMTIDSVPSRITPRNMIKDKSPVAPASVRPQPGQQVDMNISKPQLAKV